MQQALLMTFTICADMRGSALLHARFTFDRTPFKRMHQALLMAVTLPLSMQLLPPLPPSGDDSLSTAGTAGTAGTAASKQASLYRPSPEASQPANAGQDLPSDELFRAALTEPTRDRQVCSMPFVYALSVNKRLQLS